MIAQSQNPYAPPTVDETTTLPTPPVPFGWEVLNGRLLVESPSVLPMMDLYSGEIHERMTLKPVLVHIRPLWLWALPVLMPVLTAWVADRGERIEGALIGLIAGLILRWVAGLVPRPCRLRVFVVGKTYRRRRATSRMLNALFWISFFSLFQFVIPSNHWPEPARIALFAWVAGLALVLTFQHRLWCWRKQDGLYEIRRVHPDALRALGTMQERRRG